MKSSAQIWSAVLNPHYRCVCYVSVGAADISYRLNPLAKSAELSTVGYPTRVLPYSLLKGAQHRVILADLAADWCSCTLRQLLLPSIREEVQFCFGVDCQALN